MTQDKWKDLYKASVETHIYSLHAAAAPDTWEQHKQAYLNLIKEVDESVEVYNMENSRAR